MNIICPKCKSELKSPPDNNLPCHSCGYPLDLIKMLERIRNNQDGITEVIKFSSLAPEFDPDPVDFEAVMENITEYQDMLFPVKETDEIMVISIENDYFIFNFGPIGAWKNFISR